MLRDYVCHIDPKLVAEQVEKKVASYEAHRARLYVKERELIAQYEQSLAAGGKGGWLRVPSTDYIDPMIDKWIQKEREYYANVRILHCFESAHDHFEEGYYLNYDGNDRNPQAGPFETLDKAEDWFLRGGR